MTESTTRILIASGTGLCMVVGAYLLSDLVGQRPAPAPDSRQEVVAGPAPERSFIEVVDDNENGIADWRESLPGATATTTRSEDIPIEERTYTEQFAINTLENVISTNIDGSFGDPTNMLIGNANRSLADIAEDELYTLDDVVTTPNTSAAALRAYGNRIAEITFENGVRGEVRHELAIVTDALATDNAAVLAELDPIVIGYQGMVEDLLLTPVPVTYRYEHLDLINTFNALLNDVRGMRQTIDDPLYALMRIKRYEGDAKGMYQAISNLYLKLDAAGIKWTEADAVSDFIMITSR